MKGPLAVVLFIVLTAVCWGIYGPVILAGQIEMGHAPDHPIRLRPFICVGIAYFVIAVVVPLVLLRTRPEKGNWTTAGVIWSLAAGAVGAIGALGIVLAFSFKGKPLFVMPLVFGCAPVVNAFLTMYMTKTLRQVGSVFIAGLIVVAVGAITVLIFKPEAHTADVTIDEKTEQITVKRVEKDGEQERTFEVTASKETLEANHPKEYKAYLQYTNSKMTMKDFFLVTLFIILTALCWGAYGPVLHEGQGAMHGSRLRPFLCVGMAYFAIAVVVPVALLGAFEPVGEFNVPGTTWSLFGGAAGAIGALGIILAFNAGGKPLVVMPLVFGGAPVINAFTEIIGKGAYDEIGPLFYAGLILVAVGAVTVLVFAPKGHAAATPEPVKTPTAFK